MTTDQCCTSPVVAGDVIYNGVRMYLPQAAMVGGFGPWRAAIDKVTLYGLRDHPEEDVRKIVVSSWL